jgi:flagellar protein FlgJ
MNDVSNSPQSYLDFAGLGSLRGQAQQKTDKATRDTATQFEAMFIQEMLKSMREATEKSDLMGSEVGEQFEQMYDKELSMQLAKRNTMGVADMIVKQVDMANTTAAASKSANAAAALGEKQSALPLHPVNTNLNLPHGQNAMPLQRPEKFAIKPSNTVGAFNLGLKNGGAK